MTDSMKGGTEAEMFLLPDGTAVNFNPGGRFHGWLFRRYADGYWVSAKKLEPTDPLENSPLITSGLIQKESEK